MNSVAAAFPDRELHAILDNLATHKKNEHWLKKHPNVHFHFTPTRSSWLNQVETWFSILQGQSLNGASFTAGAHRCIGQTQLRGFKINIVVNQWLASHRPVLGTTRSRLVWAAGGISWKTGAKVMPRARHRGSIVVPGAVRSSARRPSCSTAISLARRDHRRCAAIRDRRDGARRGGRTAPSSAIRQGSCRRCDRGWPHRFCGRSAVVMSKR